MGIGSRLKHAWNAFTDQDPEDAMPFYNVGATYGGPPDRLKTVVSNEKSLLSSIYVRMAVDISQVDIRHVKLDDTGQYSEDVRSGLQECLTVEANLDQQAEHFRREIALSILKQGIIAIVPVDTTLNPSVTGSYEINTMRVGEIIKWMPRKVRVKLYNEDTGRYEEVTLWKKNVAIVENPFYEVMNEPNSILQRLIHKLNLLDQIEDQSASGKLDLIIQLPYVVKSEARRQQADQRRKDIEFQLKGSKYGIAYTDGTEKITQLNRPVENSLLKTIEYLFDMLYGQLGITAEIMNGTADEKTMINYNNRIIKPVLDAISGEMKRKFLTKTARTQGHSIEYFIDPFKIVPMSQLAEMVDKFTRNEVFTSNEMRRFIGVKPSSDPKADELRNSNMPRPLDEPVLRETAAEPALGDDAFDGLSKTLDDMINSLEVDLERA